MNYKDELRIALPSKGRLREDMDKLFSKKGVVFNNLTSDRDYIGSIEGIEEVEVIGQPPDNPHWIFVKSLKSGALGILQCIQK